MSTEPSTKRTLAQAHYAHSRRSAHPDNMYDVAAARVSRRRVYAEKLAGRIETIRIGMGLEPKAMAKRLGLKYETYRSYENGQRLMPPYLLVELIKISGHGAWFVLTGEADNLAPQPAPEIRARRSVRV